MGQRPKHLKKLPIFPKLTKKNNDVTSDIDAGYNCIAFAYGITDRKYWPNFHPDYYWPSDLPKVEHLDSFVQLFAKQGYKRAEDGAWQDGIEKVALFATASGAPKHAARQIGPNRWASKLGDWYDIEHEVDALDDGNYGSVVMFLERKRSSSS
jgi:hypothetical protein